MFWSFRPIYPSLAFPCLISVTAASFASRLPRSCATLLGTRGRDHRLPPDFNRWSPRQGLTNPQLGFPRDQTLRLMTWTSKSVIQLTDVNRHVQFRLDHRAALGHLRVRPRPRYRSSRGFCWKFRMPWSTRPPCLLSSCGQRCTSRGSPIACSDSRTTYWVLITSLLSSG